MSVEFLCCSLSVSAFSRSLSFYLLSYEIHCCLQDLLQFALSLYLSTFSLFSCLSSHSWRSPPLRFPRWISAPPDSILFSIINNRFFYFIFIFSLLFFLIHFVFRWEFRILVNVGNCKVRKKRLDLRICCPNFDRQAPSKLCCTNFRVKLCRFLLDLGFCSWIGAEVFVILVDIIWSVWIQWQWVWLLLGWCDFV